MPRPTPSVSSLGALRRRAGAALSRRLRARNWAKTALERYGMQDARSTLLKEEAQGKLLFRVESPTRGRFLLRVRERYPPAEDALRRELLWLQALRRETTLVVPEPVPAHDGSLVSYAPVEGAPDPLRCVLLRWLPGVHKTETLGPRDLLLVGSYVARLHRHAERYDAPEKPEGSRAWDWDFVFGEAAPLWNKGEAVYSRRELDVFRAAAERVRQDLRELGKDSSVFGLIHRDLVPGNLVFHDGRPYAIDFENCDWGFYLFDLSVTLSALEGFAEQRCAPMQRAFVEGYRRERALPEGSRRFLEAFMAMRVAGRVNTVLGWESPARLPWGPSCLAGSVEGLEEFTAGDGATDLVDFDSPWWRKSYFPGWRKTFGWRRRFAPFGAYLPARRRRVSD